MSDVEDQIGDAGCPCARCMLHGHGLGVHADTLMGTEAHDLRASLGRSWDRQITGSLFAVRDPVRNDNCMTNSTPPCLT